MFTIILAVLAALAFFCLPEYPGAIPWYDANIFYPFQSVRGWWFGLFPFSLGDIIYVAAGMAVLVSIARWLAWLIGPQQCGERFRRSFLHLINTVLFVYLFFIVGWGANYYKPSVTRYWKLREDDSVMAHLSRAELKQKIKNDLTAFDSFLVDRINIYAPHYCHLSFGEINELTKKYYALYTDSKVKEHGLGIKPTFFGWFMERLGVEGYYNPFTGEGQVNRNLPSFILPFLISHEVAHQAGIAAEGDANLVAYALCTASPDSTFRYSAYLEIWLYTNRRLYYRDSVTALRLEDKLNSLTTAHLDTLEQLARKYDNDYARYSSKVFDTYLKMQDQKEGIRSYSNVAASAWKLEQRKMNGQKDIQLHIP